MNDDTIPTDVDQQYQTDFSILAAVMVINLERSEARWNSVSHSLEKGGIDSFARIDAVDAWQLSKEQIDSAYDADTNRKHYFAPLKPGEIACFLSHRKAWRALVDQKLDGAFILEDDVLLKPGAAQSMRDIAAYANSSRPIVVKIFSKRGASGKATQISKQTRLVEQILPPIGAQGAYINKAAAEILLIQSERFYEPVDVFLQKTWTHGVRIHVLVPNALDEVSAQLGGTTLKSGKTEILSRVRREIMRPIFRISMFVRALFERAIRQSQKS